jgi:TetR/AcrR family transcriptional regulator
LARVNRKVQATDSGAGSKQAILGAALRVFARSGYDGASMPGIARLAGVAPPLIHYYFESKERLWRETVDHSLGELRAQASAVLRATHSLAPLNRLRVLLEVHAEFAARCPDHFSMIVAEARADSDRFAWLQENYTGLLFEEVVAILGQARDAGAIRDVPLTELAVMLVGAILVHFTIYPSKAGEHGGEGSSTRFVDFLFDMLSTGAVARAD